MRMIIFDDGLGSLGPMTDLRASFEIRTGMLTTAGRLALVRREPLAGYWVPRHLAAVVAQRARAPVNELPEDEVISCFNGRWAVPDSALSLDPGEAVLEAGSGGVVAAMMRRDAAREFLSSGTLPEQIRRRDLGSGLLYHHPWDVIRRLPETITRDIEADRLLDAKVPSDASVIGHNPVEVHETAVLGPYVVLDAERGPIRIDRGAVIRPGAVICGPCSIGREAVVVDRALIKPDTVIGPVCKVGGEVGGTIFQGYSNKSHEGHLGDSWVGKWVNFGAGTSNSNLLNTYGEVTMQLEPEGPLHPTGMRYVGVVVGDHVKFAIETRIVTGSVVGTGAMIATTMPPPRAVRRFAWLTDQGEQVYRFDRFIQTARTTMGRRDKTPSDAYVDALRSLHERCCA